MVDMFSNQSTVCFQMFLTENTTTASYGLLIIQTFATLAVIALVAWAFTRFIAPKLQKGKTGKRLEIVERLTLEPRRSIYLIEVDKTPLVIGVSEGSIQLIERLKPSSPTNTDNENCP